MKVHRVWYYFSSKKISKSKVHILTISGEMLLKCSKFIFCAGIKSLGAALNAI